MGSNSKYNCSLAKFAMGVSLAFFTSGIAAAEVESASPHADAIESILQERSINGKVVDASGELSSEQMLL